MTTLKIDNVYNEYIKSEDSEIIWKYCDQIENDTLKSELEKFIFDALTELNKNKFIFSLYILQGYEFYFKKMINILNILQKQSFHF